MQKWKERLEDMIESLGWCGTLVMMRGRLFQGRLSSILSFDLTGKNIIVKKHLTCLKERSDIPLMRFEIFTKDETNPIYSLKDYK